MPRDSNEAITAIDATIVRVKDGDEVLELDYTGAMSAHMGSLWWGTAVGYRAMQVAAQALSADGLWSRENLYVVGAHPGRGVWDAINYVTGVMDSGRYHIATESDCGMKCNSTMKFEFWVSDGQRTAAVKLREDFVPLDFYLLSDRLGTPQQTEEDTMMFEISKVTLSTHIWAHPLERNFSVELRDEGLAPGDLPEELRRSDYWDDLITKQATA